MLVRVARVKEMDMARSTVVLVSMQRPGEGEIAFGGGGASVEDDAAPEAGTKCIRVNLGKKMLFSE